MRAGTLRSKGLRRQNAAHAKQIWASAMCESLLQSLRELTTTFSFSIALGDLTLLDGKWYITHAGLLRLACRQGCRGIRVQAIREFCDPAARRWVFKATVYKSPRTRGFVGHGDADPSNVSPLVRGAEMRVAETRAVNRALRKAYGIGLCSVEELGSLPPAVESLRGGENRRAPRPQTISGDGQPRLRDQLRQLIGKYRLDAALVKRYAAEFCGVEDLHQAQREQVEEFVKHLAERAAQDRAALVCKLNSYLLSKEMKA